MKLARPTLVPLVATLPFLCGCIGPHDPGAARRDPLEFRDGVASSSDGVPIHYREGGRGETALVFVHGWLGNASWWEPVMRDFAASYRVVAVDLAGHGRSGKERADWTVERFADDVASVVRALELERAVLIGHSMSGPICVQAARVLGKRAVLLVPVDTLNDVEWDLPPEVWDQFFGGLRADFPNAVENFFRSMLFAPSSPPDVVERVVGDARAADPATAVTILERSRDFDLKAALRALDLPAHAINSDRNPTKLETNRKYLPRWDVTVMQDVGHWPMLEAPEAFARALEEALDAEL